VITSKKSWGLGDSNYKEKPFTCGAGKLNWKVFAISKKINLEHTRKELDKHLWTPDKEATKGRSALRRGEDKRESASVKRGRRGTICRRKRE